MQADGSYHAVVKLDARAIWLILLRQLGDGGRSAAFGIAVVEKDDRRVAGQARENRIPDLPQKVHGPVAHPASIKCFGLNVEPEGIEEFACVPQPVTRDMQRPDGEYDFLGQAGNQNA